MLERRHDARRLDTLDVRGGDGAHEVRVLADRLFHPAPPRVAHDVEHRGEPLMHPDRAHVGTDPLAHLAHQRGVECGTPAERHRVGRGAPRREAREALLVREGRDAESVRGHDPLLRALQRQRARRRIDRRRAERTGQLAQARRQDRVEVDVVVHVVLMRRDVLAVVGCPDPHAVQLRDLLGHRHLGHERVDALVDGQRRVVPRTARAWAHAPGGGVGIVVA